MLLNLGLYSVGMKLAGTFRVKKPGRNPAEEDRQPLFKKKTKIYFHRKKSDLGEEIIGTPSWYGYGSGALPKPGEKDMEPICRTKGNRFRSTLPYLAEAFFKQEQYVLDEAVTREMIRLFAEDKRTGKILLEPHLKTLLRLDNYGKIRFQGCNAARHDDHIHLQL